MKTAHDTSIVPAEALPRIPAWAINTRAKTLEEMALFSGAALGHLHQILREETVPHALLRDRLALRAAEICVAFSGRSERIKELRDEICFLRPGDQPGPAGAILGQWRDAVRHPVATKALYRILPGMKSEEIITWLRPGQGGPISQAAATFEAVRCDMPHEEAPALILADAALARALGWKNIMPLLVTGMKRQDMNMTGEDLRRACHRAVTKAAVTVSQNALDLARRAARLQAAAPKLRAKGASGAVEQFLTTDAVAPGALGTLASDRAARRLCDRLVSFDVLRELTGRETFRLYGI